MSKFDLYDLIGKLAAAATQKKEQTAPLKEENAAPSTAAAAAPADKKPFGADRAAVVEMLKRHDQKSREIDERIKEAKEEKNRP